MQDRLDFEEPAGRDVQVVEQVRDVHRRHEGRERRGVDPRLRAEGGQVVRNAQALQANFAGGAIDGTIRDLSSIGTASELRAAAAGAGMGVAFVDSREGQADVFISVLGEDWEPTSPDGRKVAATGGEAMNPFVVWTGEDFAVAWEEYGAGDTVLVWFARVDAEGNPVEGSAHVAVPFDGEEGVGTGSDGYRYASSSCGLEPGSRSSRSAERVEAAEATTATRSSSTDSIATATRTVPRSSTMRCTSPAVRAENSWDPPRGQSSDPTRSRSHGSGTTRGAMGTARATPAPSGSLD